MTRPPPARDPTCQVERLSLEYPGRRGEPGVAILKDVSVEVERGGALILVGPSGSGKSTLHTPEAPCVDRPGGLLYRRASLAGG